MQQYQHKSLLICWILTELIEKDKLNDEVWDLIKSPDYCDQIKMVVFNMLKDLGNKIDYEVISGYFEKFNELINAETKELLETAIMNPEAQIDFMDFLSALTDDDKILLIKSLECMILFKKHTANIYLYSLKNDDTHIPNQQLCTRFVHSFFFC